MHMARRFLPIRCGTRERMGRKPLPLLCGYKPDKSTCTQSRTHLQTYQAPTVQASLLSPNQNKHLAVTYLSFRCLGFARLGWCLLLDEVGCKLLETIPGTVEFLLRHTNRVSLVLPFS